MAQTGYTPISLYYSATAAAAPTSGNLVAGELAINTADGKLFYKDSAGVVQTLATKDSAAGSFVNLAYTGTLTGGTGVVNLGSGQFYKDASGNVGIGTSSPVAKLTLAGLGGWSGSNFGKQLYISTGGNPAIGIVDSTGSNPWAIANLNGALSFNQMPAISDSATFPTERMRIDSSGNVIVGATAIGFAEKFRVYGNYSVFDNGTYTGFIGAGNSLGTATSTDFAFRSSNAMAFLTGGAVERMRIDSSGNVGIGTASPSSKISVVVGADSRQAQLGHISNYPAFLCRDSDGTTVTSGFWDANQQIFANGGTERMRIDSSGNLLVGTTNALGLNGRQAIKFAGGGIQYGLIMQPVTDTTTAVAFLNASGSIIGGISISTTATAYNTSSDYRLKENIAPMTGALSTVAQLKPVTYNWKADGSSGQGFIAHELQAVVPDCVTGEKDATRVEQYEITPAIPATLDEDGKVIKEAVEAVMGERIVPVYQGIDTSFLVATLTAAIQEQQVMIEELKAKVAALEAA